VRKQAERNDVIEKAVAATAIIEPATAESSVRAPSGPPLYIQPNFSIGPLACPVKR